MCEGKVINCLENITYTKECYICGEKSNTFQNTTPQIINIDKRKIGYGISPLHLYIRVTEWLLKIGYSIPAKNLPKPEKKSAIEAKRQEVIRRIKQEKNFMIDVPSISMGRSTDGNMCRILLRDWKYFSDVLSVEEEFVERIAKILAVLNSKAPISSQDLLENSLWIFNFWKANYSFVPITPTVHKMLVHTHEINSRLPLPIGYFTEQPIESSHQLTKAFRSKHAFKSSRERILVDIFHHLLVVSHPLISNHMKKFTLNENV